MKYEETKMKATYARDGRSARTPDTQDPGDQMERRGPKATKYDIPAQRDNTPTPADRQLQPRKIAAGLPHLRDAPGEDTREVRRHGRGERFRKLQRFAAQGEPNPRPQFGRQRKEIRRNSRHAQTFLLVIVLDERIVIRPSR